MKAREHQDIVIIPRAVSTCKVLTESFFSRIDNCSFENVPVVIRKFHAFENESLQELVFAALHILTFAPRDEMEIHTLLSEVKDLMIEIFRTIPAMVLMDASNPFAGYCIEHGLHILLLEPSLYCLRTYIASAISQRKDVTDLLDVLGWTESTADKPNYETDGRYFSVLGCLDGNDDAIETLIGIYSSGLREAETTLKADMNPETYRLYLQTLGTGLLKMSSLTDPVGLYFNKVQTELGAISQRLSAFFGFMTSRIGVVASSGIVATSVISLTSYADSVLPSTLFPRFPLISIPSIFLSIGVKNSSGSLRDAICKKYNVVYPDGATLGDKEKLLSERLSLQGLNFDSHMSAFNSTVTTCFPHTFSHTFIARRLKLTLLCHKLREILMKLPIVYVYGPTRAGKTALRENLRPNPDHTAYGHRTRARTSIPQIYFCGEVDAENPLSPPKRPFCVLDSIGIGDPAGNDPRTVEGIRMANEIFQKFAGLTIIVCKEILDNDLSIEIASRTSTIVQGKHIPCSPALDHPMMTCFTGADLIFENGYDEEEDIEAELIKEARLRRTKGLPFDMRSIEQDPYFPRVWANFNPRVIVPARHSGVVTSIADVRGWILQHFYPDENV